MKMRQIILNGYLPFVEELEGELILSACLQTVKDNEVFEIDMKFSVEEETEIGEDKRKGTYLVMIYKNKCVIGLTIESLYAFKKIGHRCACVKIVSRMNSTKKCYVCRQNFDEKKMKANFRLK